MNATRTAAEKVVMDYFDALANGDDVRDRFAVDATFWYPGELPMSGTWTGRDQIIDGFLGAAYNLLDPDRPVTIEVTDVIVDGARVVVEWDSRATVKNGNPYDNKNIAVFAVHGDKIASVREYANTQHWEHALRDR